MNKVFILNEGHNTYKNGKPKPIKYIIENGFHVCVSHHRERFGYMSVVRFGERQKMHRYVYELNNDKIPNGLVVRHKCDNPSCVNPEHLELGTYLDNINDRVDRNRTAKQNGSTNPMSKLSDDDILKIKSIKGKTQNEIAEMFGISQTHVSAIRRGARWGHLTATKESS